MTSVLMLRGSGRVDTMRSKSAGGGDDAGEGGSVSFSSFANAMNEFNASDSGLAAAYAGSVWAFRCADVRASKLASIPHRVVNKQTGQVIPDHPLIGAIQSAYEYQHRSLLFDFETNLCIFGEVYIEIVRNMFRIADGLKPLNSLGVEPFIVGSQIMHYDVMEGNGTEYTRLFPQDVAYYHTFNPRDDMRGYSLMAVALNSVNVDQAMQKSTKAWFMNDSRPDGIISPDGGAKLGDKALDTIQKWLQKTLKGPKNRGRTALIPEPVKWTQVQREPVPEQPELMMSVRREICAAFGVPMSIAGAWDDANYQSAPEQRKSLYEETIFPECDVIAEFITEVILPQFDRTGKNRFEFDKTKIQAVLEDQERKSSIARENFRGGLWSFNEARIESGKDKQAGGDFFLFPAGYIPVAANELGNISAIIAQQNDPFAMPLPSSVQPSLPSGQPQLGSSSVADRFTRGGSSDGYSATAGQLPPPPRAASNTTASKSADADVAADGELKQWRKVAMQSSRSKALRFQVSAIPEPVAAYTRRALELTDFENKGEVHQVFTAAKAMLTPTPPAVALSADADAAENAAADTGATGAFTVPDITESEIEAARAALKMAGIDFTKDYDPTQPRANDGKWTDGGAGSSSSSGSDDSKQVHSSTDALKKHHKKILDGGAETGKHPDEMKDEINNAHEDRASELRGQYSRGDIDESTYNEEINNADYDRDMALADALKQIDQEIEAVHQANSADGTDRL